MICKQSEKEIGNENGLFARLSGEGCFETLDGDRLERCKQECAAIEREMESLKDELDGLRRENFDLRLAQKQSATTHHPHATPEKNAECFPKTAQQILHYLAHDHRPSTRAIASGLGLEREVIRFHLQRLSASNLVEEVREEGRHAATEESREKRHRRWRLTDLGRDYLIVEKLAKGV
jgi:DNA-binding transcriptional ArsR family regulator